MLSFLIKKELLCFIKNKLYMIIWGLLLFFPLLFYICLQNNIIPDNFNFINDYIILILCILFICSYICDSCKTEFNTGGTLFLINMKISVYVAAIIKVLTALVFGSCILVLDFCFLPDFFAGWTWYLLLLAFTSLAFFSYAVSVLLCGADTISFLILMSVSAILILMLKQPIHVSIKILFPIVLGMFSLISLPALYKRKWFRINIK